MNIIFKKGLYKIVVLDAYKHITISMIRERERKINLTNTVLKHLNAYLSFCRSRKTELLLLLLKLLTERFELYSSQAFKRYLN